VAILDAADGARPVDISSAADTAASIRATILVADDSITTRALEESMLEAAGYEVITAVDGRDAWQMLQDRGADLVVSDVEMPGMDGFGLCRAIRSSPRFARLPVVLVTALEREEHRAAGLAAGADAYIGKSSFDQRTLLDVVKQFLG
jgi:two-component system, chemotaxis family, sensor kinase CheA